MLRDPNFLRFVVVVAIAAVIVLICPTRSARLSAERHNERAAFARASNRPSIHFEQKRPFPNGHLSPIITPIEAGGLPWWEGSCSGRADWCTPLRRAVEAAPGSRS
jgi:hypothetical protein